MAGGNIIALHRLVVGDEVRRKSRECNFHGGSLGKLNE